MGREIKTHHANRSAAAITTGEERLNLAARGAANNPLALKSFGPSHLARRKMARRALGPRPSCA
eukprot:11158414-Lingulodinium_polyedra.AAC.1